jgi:ketosteroid isomerase-like protein
MEAHDELTAAERAAASGPNLAGIQKVWTLLESSGPLSAVEELVKLSHEDVEVHSNIAHGSANPGSGDVQVLRGAEEILAFHRRAQVDGISVKARARSFKVEGDNVVVGGTIRVVRGDGSFAETKLSFRYRFRDGLIDEITWESRAGE